MLLDEGNNAESLTIAVKLQSNIRAHAMELLAGSHYRVHQKEAAAEHPAQADDHHCRGRDAARRFLRAPSAVLPFDTGLPLR